MTSTDTPNIRIFANVDTTVFTSDPDLHAVESIRSFSRDEVLVRIWHTDRDQRTIALTPAEARALAEGLLRAVGDIVPAPEADDSMAILDEDPAVAEAEQQATVAKFVARFIDLANTHKDTPVHLGYYFTAEKSGRNYRIVMHDGPNSRGGSVHAFIDRTTGDVYKPEGWKKPAKGIRYNLVTEYDLVAERFHYAGGYLYADVAGKR